MFTNIKYYLNHPVTGKGGKMLQEVSRVIIAFKAKQ